MGLTPIQLMHLADSGLPIGGFAFSNGLECGVKIGIIRSQRELVDFVTANLEQIADFDLPIMRSLFEEASPWATVHDYDVRLLIPLTRDASVHQGRAWLRVIPHLFPQTNSARLLRQLEDQHCPPHFLVVFVLTLKDAGGLWDEMATLYLFLQIRDQMSAAVRLGVLGPSRAQEIQSQLENKIPTLLRRAGRKRASQACRTSPLLELTQADHTHLYTKLFQN